MTAVVWGEVANDPEKPGVSALHRALEVRDQNVEPHTAQAVDPSVSPDAISEPEEQA